MSSSSMMASLSDFMQDYRPYIHYTAIGVAVAVTGFAAHKLIAPKIHARYSGPNPKIQAPPNTVVIYQMRRGPNAPSLSPFALKMETYCRLANIPYIVDSTGRFSSKDKIPWITYNGQVVEDSEMCIDFLNKITKTDLNSHLKPEEKAVSKMIQVMIDEHMYWALATFRWVYYDPSFPSVMGNIFGIPAFVIKGFSKKITQQTKAQGMGRHTKDEIYNILLEDLKSLSVFLGNKKFMMGDKMSQGDCSVFSMLSQMVFHHFDSPVKNLLERDFPNLHAYIFRVKELLWADQADWEACCKDVVN